MKKTMRKKIALILAGCGYLDGSEIRESVLSILNLDEEGFNTQSGNLSIFAMDDFQFHTINHMNGEENTDKRNILAESARIARGNIFPLSKLQVSNFDALVMPGGFGVVKNYSNITQETSHNLRKLQPMIQNIIEKFYDAKKPIGAICISPALVALALRNKANNLTITLGSVESNNGLAESLGAKHIECLQKDIVIDEVNRVISTPAYMLEDSLIDINKGIEKLVKHTIQLI